MRILEIGKYISVAYAGMVLAEQGHEVTKVRANYEPVLDLRKGEQLYEWLNESKQIVDRDGKTISELIYKYDPHVVIENVVNLDVNMYCANVPKWISIRPSGGNQIGFDAFAQSQAFGETGNYSDFYIGDTVSGLWAAFLAAAGPNSYYCVGQAEALQKIMEGELMVKRPKKGWDKQEYSITKDQSSVLYRGEMYTQKAWANRDTKLEKLNHHKGRIVFNSVSNIDDR